MTRHHWFLCLSFILCTLCARSQANVYEHIGIQQGLPSTTVYSCFQDSKGYIWFGTDAGACRFDGYSYRTYDLTDGLKDNHIFNFYEDSQGRIWFLTYLNKLCYFQNEAIHSPEFQTPIQIGRSDDLARNMGQDHAGQLYIGTMHSGLIVVDSNLRAQTSTLLTDTAIALNIIDLGNQQSVVYTSRNRRSDSAPITSQTIQLIRNGEVVAKKVLPVGIYSILKLFRRAQSRDGSIFVSTGNTLLTCKDDSITLQQMQSGTIIHLDVDSKNRLIICTFKTGALVYPSTNLDLQKPLEHHFDRSSVTSVIQDAEGNHWFSLYSDGVKKLSNVHLRRITNPDTFASPQVELIRQINEDSALVVFKDFGLSYLHKGKLITKKKGVSNIIIDHRLLAEQIDEDRFFFYVDGTLMNYNLESQEVEVQEERHFGDVKSVIKGPNGKLYFGSSLTYGTLSDELQVSNWNTIDETRYFRASTVLPLDDSSMYVGNYAGFWYVHNAIKVKLDSIHQHFGDKIDLVKRVNDSTVVVAIEGFGLVLFYPETGETQFVESPDQKLGAIFRSVFIAENNGIWALLPRGILHVEYPSRETHVYSYLDGIPTCQLNDLHVLNDTVYLATNCGLYTFIPSAKHENKVPPPIYFRNISILGQDTLILPEYKLNHTQNFVVIDFVGIYFRSFESLRYQYRMVEQSEDKSTNYWQTTSNLQVQFPNLAPGNYTFQVRAITPDNVVSSSPATVRFLIAPPYWETWWFLILTNLAIIGAVVLMFYIALSATRHRHQIARQQLEFEKKTGELKQLALRAQMDPHFIFNALTSIQNFVLNNDTAQANHYLTRFAKLTRAILEHSAENWVLLEEEIALLRNYLHLQQMRLDHKFDYTVEMDEELSNDNFMIPPMLVQPFIENAIIHGILHLETKGEIHVNFHVENDQVICIVQDNGIGRIQSAALNAKDSPSHKSKAMNITQERMELLKTVKDSQASIKVEDLEVDERATGTKVILMLPSQFPG
jgi:hypothetical protein